ncbi:PD40 domain-containing protein [Sphingomonas sp. BT553]|uniref:Tricorn protease homolog n=2 Tax=Sphingomonas mollis TaxID=2795726 RepID=A0ABS0XP58_9SPHN|nr:PD40 domain-containing protein [Sphingomonas sp. BT553]
MMRTMLAGLLAATCLSGGAIAQEAARSPTPAPAPIASVVAKPSLGEPALSPDGSTIAFVSGGDIWEVPAAGGVARLLVTDAATEGRPLYAPDGRTLAFTSNRGGSTNIFLLDLASGVVKRLTYAEATEELDAWSADGRWLYFSSAATDIARQPDIFRVAATGGTPLEVSRERYLSEFQAAPSPDGARIALMTRGLSNVQWWRNGHSHIDETELWTKAIEGDGGYTKLLADGAKHAWPMWSADGQTMTFMSDKGGTENLWRLSLAAGATPQPLTRFTDGRVLFPSMGGGGAIVFERDMRIWRFDPATGQATPVPITLRGAPAAERSRFSSLTSFDRLALSPDGQKVALIAHGELFAASTKDGGTAQRITDSIASERDPVWSPDSRRLLYVTERGLEQRLAQYDVAAGKETLLTAGAIDTMPFFAPDGRSIVYVRGGREIRRLVPAAAGKPATDTLLYTGALGSDGGGPPPVWSPDGKWIAFPVIDARSFMNVWVVPATGGEARAVSFLGNGQMSRIAWSPDGTFILFDTAQRTEDSRIVRVDLLPHVPQYREDGFRDLFKSTPGTPGDPATDAAPKPASANAAVPSRKAGAKADTPTTPTPVRIVWEGLRERATVLPLGLNAERPTIAGDGKTLVFMANAQARDNLYSYSLDERAAEPPSAQQISATDKRKGDFGLSADGKTIAWLEGGRVMVTPVADPKPRGVAINADMTVDFAAERQVVFDQAWNNLNRYFYDPQFHGQDWTALRARFAPYVAGAQTGDELRRVINLMIGELNASHSGIGRPSRGPGALPTDRVGDLGLRFDRTAYEAGRGLIVRELVPLGPAAIEGTIRPGDRIAGVDGEAIGATGNLDALLENKVGLRVTLGIVTAGRARDVVVQPVSASTAAGLLYRGWVNDRRAMVERLSGGKLGYVHILDMSADSLTQLYLDLDTQNQSRQGVVVDVRNNNGGFVNGYALDVFSRRNYLTMTMRGLPPVPGRQALGQRALGLPTVLVTNESSLSDAEDFTEGYRSLGLGKVVGQPTAGWIIYTSPETLIDGSVLRVPQTRVQDGRGQNMEMNPRPVDLAVERPLGQSDRDLQLEAAVQQLLAGPSSG